MIRSSSAGTSSSSSSSSSSSPSLPTSPLLTATLWMFLSYSTQLGCSSRYRFKFFSMGEAKPLNFFPLTVSHSGTLLWPGER